MHFHLPKPLHGWREFVGEVSIIVLGVLIALSAEQLVEWIHWRESVAAVQSAMDQELSNDRARWDAMMRAQPCALQRLDEMERWSRTAPPQERFDRFRSPTIWSNRTNAWQMAKAGDTLTHIPLTQRLAYSGLYDHLELMQPFITSESDLWDQLATDLATADDPQSRSDLRRSIVQARRSAILLNANYATLTKEFDRLGVKADPNSLPIRRARPAICEPMRNW